MSNAPAMHRRALACLKDFLPMLLDRTCQLVGQLINMSRARKRDEFFMASGMEQVEMALRGFITEVRS